MNNLAEHCDWHEGESTWLLRRTASLELQGIKTVVGLLVCTECVWFFHFFNDYFIYDCLSTKAAERPQFHRRHMHIDFSSIRRREAVKQPSSRIGSSQLELLHLKRRQRRHHRCVWKWKSNRSVHLWRWGCFCCFLLCTPSGLCS